MPATINASSSSGIVTTADNSAQLELQTASTTRLTIDSSGNVGIGTTSPQGTLQITRDHGSQPVPFGSEPQVVVGGAQGGAGAQGYMGSLWFASSDGGTDFGKAAGIVGNALADFSPTSRAGHLEFYTTASGSITPTERMRITSAGDVGIGTSSPADKLHVNGGDIRIQQVVPELKFVSEGNINRWYIGANISDSVDGGMCFGNGTGVGNNERMRIDSSGNVGIGVTSPGAKLDVNGVIVTRGDGTEGGQINFNNPTNADAGMFIDVGTADRGRIYSVNNNSELVLGQLVGTGGNIQLYTAAAERMRINSTGYVTNAVNGLGNGIVQAQQYFRLNSTVVGANATGAQSLFGVGVTLVGSTQYEFEVVYMLAKTAGITSHTVSVGFGGTATLNNIGYFAVGTDNSAAISGRGGGTSGGFISSITASAVVFTAAIASATSTVSHIIKGTVSVNAGGTFIPQYTLSAAPGGAYTTQIGSYFKIAPLAASGANVSIGTWA